MLGVARAGALGVGQAGALGVARAGALGVGQAGALGVAQGVAEVVPVSSSAQLVLLPWLLDWPPPADRTTFAAGLHAGSCLGIGWALRDELRRLSLREVAVLAAVSVPAAVGGAWTADAVEERLGRPPQLAALLAGFGALMWWVDARAAPRSPRGTRRQRPAPAVQDPGLAVTARPGRTDAGVTARQGRTDAAVTGRRGRTGVARSAGPDSHRDGRTQLSGTSAAVPGAAVPGAAVPGAAVPGAAVPGAAVTRAAVTGAAVPGGFARVDARQAAVAGLAQVAALIPGVSRSGATLTALRALGVHRAEAERFSLLMSLPITAGAAGLTLARADRRVLRALGPGLAAGCATAAVTGAAVATRRRAHPGRPLAPAALYRLGLAAVVAVRLIRKGAA